MVLILIAWGLRSKKAYIYLPKIKFLLTQISWVGSLWKINFKKIWDWGEFSACSKMTKLQNTDLEEGLQKGNTTFHTTQSIAYLPPVGTHFHLYLENSLWCLLLLLSHSWATHSPLLNMWAIHLSWDSGGVLPSPTTLFLRNSPYMGHNTKVPIFALN